MGEKDITQKTLEAYNDVFADIVNVLLFDGKRIIREDDLEDASVHSQYKADDRIHEQERDVVKYWKNGNIRIALYGLENQMKVDRDMPLRVISYDSAAYRAQLLADTHKDEGSRTGDLKNFRYPAVTLVLYFGYEQHWNKPSALLDCLYIPVELKPFVSDYKINIFEIAWLSDDKLKMFKSDFRIVADYFSQMRKNKNYIPSADTIRHVHETLQLLTVLTKDRRFEEAYCGSEKGGADTTMCEVLDRIENRGYDRGLEKGLEKGLEQGKEGMAYLYNVLIESGRMEELNRITKDLEYRKKLFDELVPEDMNH